MSSSQLRAGKQPLVLLAAAFALALSCLVILSYRRPSSTALLSGPSTTLGDLLVTDLFRTKKPFTNLEDKAGEDEEPDAVVGATSPRAAHVINARGDQLVNRDCVLAAKIMDGAATGYPEWAQKQVMARCMDQDCEQSMRTVEGKWSGCRFTDANGFCYHYYTAQQYCFHHPDDSDYCNDKGPDAAKPPLGEYTGESSEIGWEPVSDVTLTLPTRPDLDGSKYACSCMRNCGCNGQGHCWCMDPEQQPIGTDEGSYTDTNITEHHAARGRCSCSCGGVAARLHSEVSTLRGSPKV